jgi:predicted Zn-dependent protease with MMP-like domain
VIGSPYYWAFVGAITLAFAVIDLIALSRRDMGRPQGVAIAIYVTAWVVVSGLSLPIAPLGSLWWVFPAAVRIAVSTMLVGGQILAGTVRAEQAIVHHERQQAPPTRPRRELSEAELRVADAYDALWQVEDRQRNHERELRKRRRGAPRSRSTRSKVLEVWARRRARRGEYEHSHPLAAEELTKADETAPPISEGDDRGRGDFETLVQRAVDALPAHLRELMSNVEIVIEDEPPPGEHLLGLYRGIPLTARDRGYVLVLPDKITIYRGPLERLCANDLERLESEVKRTVLHEIAHHFGISDERLIEIDRY